MGSQSYSPGWKNIPGRRKSRCERLEVGNWHLSRRDGRPVRPEWRALGGGGAWGEVVCEMGTSGLAQPRLHMGVCD